MRVVSNGKAIIQSSRPFSAEDSRKTWLLFSETVAVGLVLALVAASTVPLPFRVAASLLLGLTIVRMFIFYHDCLHRALFRDSKLGRGIMWCFGLVVLTPPKVWRESHNYHHAHTSKLVGSSIGSYPLLTTKMYHALPTWQRIGYRLTRHWLTILFGYFTIFLGGMILKNLVKHPLRYWDAALSLVVHAAVLFGLWSLGGFPLAFLVLLLPMFVAMATGAYLFYAQHTFPGMELYDRRSWEYASAALHSSSMTAMGPILRWFTGNIGYHHVHHLNPSIPFYRLPEAMRAVPELQDPIVTTLRPRDILACLRIHLWDPDRGEMISFREAVSAPTRTPT